MFSVPSKLAHFSGGAFQGEEIMMSNAGSSERWLSVEELGHDLL